MSCGTGERVKDVKNTKKLLEHFRRSTAYQKRNGTHNSHSVAYKITKKANEQDDLVNSSNLGVLAFLSGSKKNLSLDKARDVNNDLLIHRSLGVNPSDLNNLYAEDQGYNPDKGYLRNKVEDMAIAAPALYATNKLIANPLGTIARFSKLKHSKDIAAGLSKWQALSSTARATGSVINTLPAAAASGVKRLFSANLGKTLATSGANVAKAGGKFLRFAPNLKTLPGWATVGRTGLGQASKGLSKTIPYFGLGMQAFDYALSGDNMYDYGKKQNNLAAISAMKNQSNSAWRGLSDSLTAGLTVPANIIGTGQAAWDSLGGVTNARRTALSTNYSSLTEKNKALSTRWNQLRDTIKARKARK